MTGLAALGALLVGVGVWLAVPPAPDRRATAVLPTAPRPSSRSPLTPRVACIAAAIAVAVLAPGAVGLGIAAGIALGGPLLLARFEPASLRQRRERIGAQAPIVADVLAAALSTGVPLSDALDCVADAVGPPAGDVLRATSRAMSLGSDSAWGAMRADERLRPIADALERASRTGAPLSGVLASIADDLRRRHIGAVEVAARSAGVRAILPLAVCFLPAFLLLGVVPVVAALAGPYLAH